MKQVSQRLRDGRIEVLDVPPPVLSETGVLVSVRASLLSAGTERTKVETARLGLIGKARARPDQVRKVIEKARRDGLGETVRAVRMQLDKPSALGYSAAGVVLAVGSRVGDLAPGDRVACGGGDYAVHAEVDHVPGNLCVPVPVGVGFDAAAFATVGSIALHGVRQADARLGERVAVIGLGLVGQLAGQILRASGCTVVGVDLAPELVERALTLGAADVAYPRAELVGSGLPPAATGCDAVLVTAATSSDDPVRLAAELCRDRGRVVVVGLVGMELPRAPYYEKELELRLSRSYGPGRYDREYEERGLDYPIGYVRWTERRNMAAFLELVAGGKVDVLGLVTERVPVEEAPAAYDRLLSSTQSPLGVVIEYASHPSAPEPPLPAPARSPGTLDTGIIGPGSFAQRLLVPGLAHAGFHLVAAAGGSGLSAHAAAERFGFARTVSPDELIADPGLGVIAIATRHASHAALAAAALRAGKAVFVEKPPALSWSELADLRSARDGAGLPLAVGFNRRHAPLAVRLREHIAAARQPIQIVYRVKAGPVDPAHWVDDVEEGGGRLLGEGCHFVDFACWLVGRPPRRITCAMAPAPGQALAMAGNFSIALEFEDASIATIVYSTAGSPQLGKELVEVHAGERSARLDDFRVLTLFDHRSQTTVRNRAGDKGHRAEFEVFRRRLEGEADVPPDPLDTMAATLAALEAAQLGLAVDPGLPGSEPVV